MGRPNLSRHRKFKRLARTLEAITSPGFGEPLARGLLEAMWDVAYENGDPLLGDAEDVEAAAGWRGKVGALTAALESAGGDGSAGFIEAGGTPWWPEGTLGTYRVHDLWDHAPDYVQRRATREAERRAKGKTISDLRQDAANARWHKQPADGCMQPADGCMTAAAACIANGATPAPAPAPAPAQEEAAPPAASPPADVPRAKRKQAKDPDPRHAPLREKLAATFLEVIGSPYGFHGGKDGKAISDLLRFSEGDVEEVDRRWRAALARRRWPMARTFATLASRWNDVAHLCVAARANAKSDPLAAAAERYKDSCPAWAGFLRDTAGSGSQAASTAAEHLAPLRAEETKDRLVLTARDPFGATRIRDLFAEQIQAATGRAVEVLP